MVRKDIIDIIGDIKGYEQIKNIAITTNGTLLYRKLERLKEVGLNSINISLDSLVEAKS